MIKNTILSNRNKYKNKNNCNSSNQKLAKVFSMSEGNTCVVEPNLEVLPLI